MAKAKKNYTDLDEQELAKEIKEQYALAKLFLDPVHERMNAQEELYRTYIDKNNYPHNARVFDPRVFRVIETITPRMVSKEPQGSFYPMEKGDEAVTAVLNELIKWDWQNADMFPKLVKFAKSLLIFGTAFGRVYWDYEEKEKRRMVPKTINGRTVWSYDNTEKQKVVTKDNPNFEVLNIYDCFFDPNATDLESMRWFIYRRFKTLEELKAENETRGIEYYKNLDKLEEAYNNKNKGEAGADGMTGVDDIQWREHRRVMLANQEFIGKDESNKDIVILTRLTRDGWCDIVPEYGDLVIREVENPYFNGDLPIIYGVDYPYPGELLGMGEIEPIDRIQRAINATLNQRLDNVQLTLRSMWKVRKNAGVDLHTLVSAPGNVVTTDDMNAVEALQVPDVTGPTFVQTMNYLTSSLQNGSGISDYTVGTNSENTPANKTATGIRLIQQEANAQFKLKIQLFNHMVVQRIANLWKDLRIQYTTDELLVRVIGREKVKELLENTNLAKIGFDGEEILPGDMDTPTKLQVNEGGTFAFLRILPDDIQPAIVGDYDFIAATSSEQINDPIAMQENFFVALERVQDPNWQKGLMEQGKMLNYVTLTEKVFDKLNLGIETSDVLTEAPKQQDPQQQMPEQPVDIMGEASAPRPTSQQILPLSNEQ